MPDKNPAPEPPMEDDFYDGDKNHDESSADFDVEETNAKEVSE